MPKNIYVFLAEGFEETEAIATIDLLRRAGLPTHIVTIEDEPHVTGAHGRSIVPMFVPSSYRVDSPAYPTSTPRPAYTN